MGDFTMDKKALIADLLKNPLKFWKFKRGMKIFLDDFYGEHERAIKLSVKLRGLNLILNSFRKKDESIEKEIGALKNEVIELKHTIAGLRKELEKNVCNCKK